MFIDPISRRAPCIMISFYKPVTRESEVQLSSAVIGRAEKHLARGGRFVSVGRCTANYNWVQFISNNCLGTMSVKVKLEHQ